MIAFFLLGMVHTLNKTKEEVFDDKVVKYDPTKTQLKPAKVHEEPITDPLYFYIAAVLLSLITLFFVYKILKFIFPEKTRSTENEWKDKAFDRNQQFYASRASSKRGPLKSSGRNNEFGAQTTKSSYVGRYQQ